jgi:hypothetical protein
MISHRVEVLQKVNLLYCSPIITPWIIKKKRKHGNKKKGDIGLDISGLLVTQNQSAEYFSIIEDSASTFAYGGRDGVFNANISFALSKHWAIQLGFSRLYNYSYISLDFKKPITIQGTILSSQDKYSRWFENQWTLAAQYQYPLTKRLFLKSKAGLMLFLHKSDIHPTSSDDFVSLLPKLIEDKISPIQKQTFGLNGEVGAELRLIKPLSLISSIGYIHNFNKAVYEKTGTVQMLNQKYAFSSTSTFRMRTFSLGLKYNLGYFYNGNKENYWW